MDWISGEICEADCNILKGINLLCVYLYKISCAFWKSDNGVVTHKVFSLLDEEAVNQMSSKGLTLGGKMFILKEINNHNTC